MKVLITYLFFAFQLTLISQDTIGFSNYIIGNNAVTDSSICPCGYDSIGVDYQVTTKIKMISNEVVLDFKRNALPSATTGDVLQKFYLYDSFGNLITPDQDPFWFMPWINTPHQSYSHPAEKYQVNIGETYTMVVKYFISPNAIVRGDVCIGAYAIGQILSKTEYKPQYQDIDYIINLAGQYVEVIPENRILIAVMKNGKARKIILRNNIIQFI